MALDYGKKQKTQLMEAQKKVFQLYEQAKTKFFENYSGQKKIAHWSPKKPQRRQNYDKIKNQNLGKQRK